MCFELTTPKDTGEAFANIVKVVTPKKLSQKIGGSLTHWYRMAATEFNGEKRADKIRQALDVQTEGLKKGLLVEAYVIADAFVQNLGDGAEITFRHTKADKPDFKGELIDSMTAMSQLAVIAQKLIEGEASYLQVRWAKKTLCSEADQLVDIAMREHGARLN